MSNTGSVSTRSVISESQMRDLCSAAVQSVPTDLPFLAAEHWESNKSQLVKKLSEVFWSAPVVSTDSPVLAGIVSDCQQTLKKMFGKKHCPEVCPLPKSVTEEKVVLWAKFNMYPKFIPELDLSPNSRLPRGFVRPGKWFQENVKNGNIKEIHNLSPYCVKAGWYLVDGSHGVHYTDGTQMFPDDPFEPLITELREEGLIGKYDETPMGSCFSIIPDEEWIKVVLPAMAGLLKVNQARLMRYTEFNAIGNLFFPHYGDYNMWVWLEDLFEDSDRLIGGYRDNGGLAHAHYNWRDARGRGIAGRPLVVL